jgi:hypothetical protein
MAKLVVQLPFINREYFKVPGIFHGTTWHAVNWWTKLEMEFIQRVTSPNLVSGMDGYLPEASLAVVLLDLHRMRDNWLYHTKPSRQTPNERIYFDMNEQGQLIFDFQKRLYCITAQDGTEYESFDMEDDLDFPSLQKLAPQLLARAGQLAPGTSVCEDHED